MPLRSTSFSSRPQDSCGVAVRRSGAAVEFRFVVFLCLFSFASLRNCPFVRHRFCSRPQDSCGGAARHRILPRVNFFILSAHISSTTLSLYSTFYILTRKHCACACVFFFLFVCKRFFNFTILILDMDPACKNIIRRRCRLSACATQVGRGNTSHVMNGQEIPITAPPPPVPTLLSSTQNSDLLFQIFDAFSFHPTIQELANLYLLIRWDYIIL